MSEIWRNRHTIRYVIITQRRVIFKTTVLVWKCIHGVAPAYLQELRTAVETVQGCPGLWSVSTGCVQLPRVPTSIGHRSFTFYVILVKLAPIVYEHIAFTRFSSHCLLWPWPFTLWPQIWSARVNTNTSAAKIWWNSVRCSFRYSVHIFGTQILTNDGHAWKQNASCTEGFRWRRHKNGNYASWPAASAKWWASSKIGY